MYNGLQVYKYTGCKIQNGEWVEIDPDSVHSVSCSDFEEYTGEVTEEIKKSLYIQPPLMAGSDYCGTCVERSNHDVFLRDCGNLKGVLDVYGGYGSYGVAIRLDVAEDNDEVADILSSLEDYCLLDDGHHSKMESDAYDEAWKDWAEHDTRNEILSILEKMEMTDLIGEPDAILDKIESDDLRVMFEEVREQLNEYWITESGGIAYIPVEKIAEALGDYILLKNINREVLPTLMCREWKTKEVRNIYDRMLKGESYEDASAVV